MGAALVFVGHKLHVPVAEGWIRGRRHTVAAADDPSLFGINVATYADFAVIIDRMVLHGILKASR